MRINSGRRFDAPVGKTGCRLATLAALAGVMLASPALAESPSTATDAFTGLSSRVDVKLTGRIDARCMLSGGGDLDLGELQGGEGAKANFGLDCNVPFEIDIRSARGGLAHSTLPQGQGPYSGLLGYDLRLVVPTLSPTPGQVEGRYTSRDLIGARKLSSGDGIGAGGGTLEFRMHHPEGAGLLAGAYRETVSLTITPRM